MKEFLETTLPARLEKYEALLKSKDEGKGFFLGAKVSKHMGEKRLLPSILFHVNYVPWLPRVSCSSVLEFLDW